MRYTRGVTEMIEDVNRLPIWVPSWVSVNELVRAVSHLGEREGPVTWVFFWTQGCGVSLSSFKVVKSTV